MFGPYSNTWLPQARLSDIQPRGGLPGPGITAELRADPIKGGSHVSPAAIPRIPFLGPETNTGHNFAGLGDCKMYETCWSEHKPSGAGKPGKGKGAPPPGQNPPVPHRPEYYMTAKGLALGLLGGSVVGMLMTGAPLVDVATSLDGALGATLGVVAGAYAAPSSAYGALIGAIAVPAVIGGQLDATVAGIGAAAYFLPQFA